MDTARYSVKFNQTRKERVPWAHWILRAVAIGSAVWIGKSDRDTDVRAVRSETNDLHKT